MQETHTIASRDQLSTFAHRLVAHLLPNPTHAVVVTLSGDLGAGKTTLAQMIARELGVTEVVNSPTYVITKYYNLKNQSWMRLIHIDAYRLDGENLEPLGFEELFSDPSNIIIVEWPQYIESILPPSRSTISLTQESNDVRTVHITTQYT